MFREMRRKAQALPDRACEEILENATSGVLAVLGDGGYPYAVPLSYAWEDGRLYFHCAKSGHKLDAVRACEKASFCVVAQDSVVAEKYTTHYRSVIAFGRVRVLEDGDEMRRAIERLAMKYAPADSAEGRQRAINRAWDALCLLEMTVEHMTGKEAKDLMKKRAQAD